MIRSKKAWVRIVEAFIAIMIVAAALAIIVDNQAVQRDSGEKIYKIERALLEEAAMDEGLRIEVLNNNDEALKSFFANKTSLKVDARICEVDEACGILNLAAEDAGKNIYADEILISSTIDIYSPKKLKIFIII